MQKITQWPLGIVVALLIGLTSTTASAHGDVVPHPVDTTGLKALGTDWAKANPYRGDKKAEAIGLVGYEQNCAGCHGLYATSGGVAPDLLKLEVDCLDMASKDAKESCLQDADDFFKEVTLKGKKNSEGRYTMPAYSSVFTQEAVWAVKAYIDARTIEENSKK